MQPCIPGVEWTGQQLRELFPEAAESVEPGEFFRGVTVDSRRPVAGGIFVALRGRRVDAHSKLPEAFAGGVKLAIVERSVWYHFPADWQQYRCLPVGSSRKALAELARRYRQRYQIPVVALAGSAGKTTTKELVAAVLSQRFRVLKTVGNENNLLGVSLTLLQLRPEHGVAVLEFGTNSVGEIALLCLLAQPTCGVITAIGQEHLAGLGSLEGVVQEETALLRFLQQVGGTHILPADEPLLPAEGRGTTFGLRPGADIWATSSLDGEGWTHVRLHYGGRVLECRLPIVGKAAARAAAAAAAVAWVFGLSAEEVREGLCTYQAEPIGQDPARLLLVRLPNGVRILNDTYNANPLSMQMALETLGQLPCTGRRWAILGDMLELGDAAPEAHRAILAYARAKAEVVCVLGEHFAALTAEFPDVHVFVSHEEAAEYVWRWAQTGDVVLLKGSRALAMERVVALYQQRLYGGESGRNALPSSAVGVEGV